MRPYYIYYGEILYYLFHAIDNIMNSEENMVAEVSLNNNS